MIIDYTYMHASNNERKRGEPVANNFADVPRSRTALRGCKVGLAIDRFVHVPGKIANSISVNNNDHAGTSIVQNL
jgi:hypothetical protein